MNSKKVLFLLLLIGSVAGTVILGCKKIDLVRLAHVTTGSISDISQNSATAHGSVIDLGDGGIKDHGFCWSLSSITKLPTINNSISSIGAKTIIGDFSSFITGLMPNSDYYLRSYAEDENGIFYGESVKFTTPTTGGSGFWLKYDDGINYTGIGLTDGSYFDYAIRFPVQALTNYNGYRVSKFRFFPRETANFHVEIYEGAVSPMLVYYEDVTNPVLSTWNEYTPTEAYYIDSDVEVWAGIWVTDYVQGTFPAGADEGPAAAGSGDMISLDSGLTWFSLSTENPDLNYNWNLEIYITNQKGEEIKLVNNPISFHKEKSTSGNSGCAKNLASDSNVN
jgi:hypothetical protein